MNRLLILVVALCSALSAQGLNGLRYLGEIGHIGPPFDKRKQADLRIAKVFPDADFAIQGVDDAGKPWRADIPVGAGVGWTDAWKADLDGKFASGSARDCRKTPHKWKVCRCADDHIPDVRPGWETATLDDLDTAAGERWSGQGPRDPPRVESGRSYSIDRNGMRILRSVAPRVFRKRIGASPALTKRAMRIGGSSAQSTRSR